MGFHGLVKNTIGFVRCYFFLSFLSSLSSWVVWEIFSCNLIPVGWRYGRCVNMIENTLLISFWVTLDYILHDLLIFHRNKVMKIPYMRNVFSDSASSTIDRRWASRNFLAFALTFSTFFLRFCLIIPMHEYCICGREPALDNFFSLAIIKSSLFVY